MRYMRVLAVLLVFGGIAVGAGLAAQTTPRSAARLPALHQELQQFLVAHPRFFPGPLPVYPVPLPGHPRILRGPLPRLGGQPPQLAVPGAGPCFVAGCSIKPCVIPVASSGPGYQVAPVPSLSGRCQPQANRFRVATVIAR